MDKNYRKRAPAIPTAFVAMAAICLIPSVFNPDETLAQHIVVVEPGTELAQQEENNGQGSRSLPPAYDSQMLRLAEILGSLHYLRYLCGADEGQLWREQMQELLDKEEPSEERRMRLTARFNRGFRDFQEVYRECTPAAAEAANRYLRQGSRLAAEIPGRYGN